MIVVKTCFSCGKKTKLVVDDKSYSRWKSGDNIASAFPDMHKFNREVLISGMCHDCQSKTFNQPKPGEDWGELVGTCPCCDRCIYPKDIVDGTYNCPSCGEETKFTLAVK